MLFSAGEIVSEPEVKHLRCLLSVGRVNADKSAGCGIHRSQRHHVRIVFAESLGALYGEFGVFKLREDILLLLLVIREPRLVLRVYLIERRLRDIDLAVFDKLWHKAVNHGENERAYLESVNVGIGADYDLVPAQLVDIKGDHILHRL